MKLHDILTESEQINEGPVGSAVGAGLGALAGGPLGAAAGGAIGNWAGDKLAGSKLGSKLKGAWQGAKGQSAQNPSQATAPTPQTATAPMDLKQIIQAVKALDPKSKQRLLVTLQKQLGQAPKPAAKATGGSGAFGQMAQGLSGQVAPNTQNSPVSARNTAPKPRTGGKVSGQVSNTPNAVRKRASRVASKAMAESVGFQSKFLGQII